jgi:hypothetical protein
MPWARYTCSSDGGAVAGSFVTDSPFPVEVDLERLR